MKRTLLGLAPPSPRRFPRSSHPRSISRSRTSCAAPSCTDGRRATCGGAQTANGSTSPGSSPAIHSVTSRHCSGCAQSRGRSRSAFPFPSRIRPARLSFSRGARTTGDTSPPAMAVTFTSPIWQRVERGDSLKRWVRSAIPSSASATARFYFTRDNNIYSIDLSNGIPPPAERHSLRAGAGGFDDDIHRTARCAGEGAAGSLPIRSGSPPRRQHRQSRSRPARVTRSKTGLSQPRESVEEMSVFAVRPQRLSSRLPTPPTRPVELASRRSSREADTRKKSPAGRMSAMRRRGAERDCSISLPAL